jgi:hypothetical protein
MRHTPTAVALSLLLLFCGGGRAAADGPAPQGGTTGPEPDDRFARVFVYRHHKATGAALEPPVYCDDRKVADMDNGRYFLLRLEPGVHSIRSNSKKAVIEMEFEAGKEYFVRVYLKATYVWVGQGQVMLEPADRGRADLEELRPLDPSDVVDDTLVFLPRHDAG